jgi:hypothetical protein
MGSWGDWRALYGVHLAWKGIRVLLGLKNVSSFKVLGSCVVAYLQYIGQYTQQIPVEEKMGSELGHLCLLSIAFTRFRA